MKRLCSAIFTAAVWASILATASAAEQPATCKLELVPRPPLPDDWREAKKVLMFYGVDSQTFHRGTENGITFVNSEGDFRQVVKKEPKNYIAKRPLRGVAILGSKRYAFVLDHKSKESMGYDRLYFDLIGNGDLTDDKPLDALPDKNDKKQMSSSRISDNRGFPRVVVLVDVEGRKLEYPLELRRQYELRPDYEYVRLFLTVEAYRRGEITLGGKKHTIAVLDWNSNGRFDDVLSLPQQPHGSNNRLFAKCGDVLLIDPEKLPVEDLSWGRPLGEHRQFIGQLAVLEGKYYRVKVSPAGDELALTPVSVACGQVASPCAPCHVELISEMGYLDLSLEKSKPATVPAGQWRLLSYGFAIHDWKEPKKKARNADLSPALLAALDAELPLEDRWFVSAYGTTNNSPIVVKAGQTTTLKFGPPYRTVVEVNRWQGKTFLKLSLHGTDGEVVDGLTINGRSPDKPKLTITDPKDKIVARGELEYG